METLADTITEENGMRSNAESGSLPLNLMCSLYYEASFDDSFHQAAVAAAPGTVPGSHELPD